MKPKKCKQCKKQFLPERPLQSICSYHCAAMVARNKTKKEQKKKDIEAKKSLLTHKDYLKMLQVVVNTYVRKRDLGKPCISCGVELKGKFDAGHYYSVGANSNLRFNLLNIHGQCVHCNQHLHGNLIEYGERLVERIGIVNFNKLKEEKNISFKLTIAEIKEKIKHFKSEIKYL